jgi:hypothetical protein
MRRHENRGIYQKTAKSYEVQAESLIARCDR